MTNMAAVHPSVEVLQVVERTKEFATLCGMQMRSSESPSSSEIVHYGPFSLFPSIIPQSILCQAKETQKDFNILMHKVAHDHEFLSESLKNVIKVDDFTRNIWHIYETIREEGVTQPVCLGLFRNDYMMDTGGNTNNDLTQLQLKQIEFNMIASSFAGLESQMRDIHRFSLTHSNIEFDDEKLPVNNCAHGLANGMVHAWRTYKKESAYVLFLVDEIEKNRMDQVWIEREMFNIDRHCKVIYRSLQYVGKNGRLQASKELIIDGMEIAVVYFRSGYAPNNYTSKQDWETRLKIERSKAIKCPTVNYQLAGTKKIQQELARTGAVERFLKDPAAVARVRRVFAGQYNLDKGQEGDEIIKRAKDNPHKFVVKPQREGGGNNIYDEEIPEFLNQIQDSEERSAYIIMDRIFPFVQENYLIRKGEEIALKKVVNEIGIYGVLLGSDTEIKQNEEVGHLVRTKNEHSNEGGIMVGFSVIDSPYVISNINERWNLYKLK